MEEKVKSTSKKKPWKPMEMAKVPLNQDQAVLTCCDSQGREMVWEGTWQCTETQPFPDCGLGAMGWANVSS